MKFSYNWISELVEGLGADAKTVERWITIKTAECEGVEEVGALLTGASEATVVSVEPVGKGHNVKAVVETAKYGQKTVICGAPNCRPGLRTVYVPLGKKVIDGVESDGMLASAAELGISRDHEGILEFSGSLDLKPDYIIEVDNKSLTHRPDLWGHYGMAREVAAILGKRLIDPVKPVKFAKDPELRIVINDPRCFRYSALRLENVVVQPSPRWLQYRLEAVGLNPINNIVDVTNYVMAELAQPMHAFDAAKLSGPIVIEAAGLEAFLALDGRRYDLLEDLVITDASGPIALAGVIGGKDSAISDSTSRIVLESASFDASSIRKTSARLKLRTDASMRFEKAQDPVNTVRALQRAFDLLQEVSPGIRVAGFAEDGAPPPAPAAILLPLDWLDRKLGRSVPASEVRGILESLAFTVEEIEPRVFSVGVPSWRATKDVSIKDDLLEEIGRMVGYDSITPTPPLTPARVPRASPQREFHHRVREIMTQQGFTEVYNYSFVSEEMARAFGLDASAHIEVRNPIAADQNLLRRSLLPGIWKNIGDNARHFETFRLFEIGREVHPDKEIPHVTAAIFAKDDGGAALFELKRTAECLLAGVEVQPTSPRSFEHPQRAAEVRSGSTVLGRLFEFHPRMVEHGRAAVLDIDLLQLKSLQPSTQKYQPLRRYPVSAFDLSVLAAERAHISGLEKQLTTFAGSDLVSLAFLRDFKLPDSSRSVSFRITVGAPDRTLSNDEVTAIRTRLIDGMRAAGYELRV